MNTQLHNAHHGPYDSTSQLATSATAHCLTGCAIGEFIGLAIGVSLGLGPWVTMGLATVLGFISGFALSLIPLMRSGLSLWVSFRSIWLGETISIAVMEFAMNFADYHVGGVTTNSMLEPLFWIGFGAAIVAGFIAAWPINFYMLKTNLKQVCH
ncbi:MAG: DUF4396 domain-containing protein [Gammaproteobacteria bacterium]